MAKSFNNIINSMISFIKSVKPTVDVSEGTIFRDIVVDVPAQEIAKLYSELEIASLSQSLLTAPDSTLDKIASNLGLVRKNARQSKGYITFFKRDTPTFDITIPAGTVVSTSLTTSTESQRFTTLSTVTMYASLASTYFNPDTEVYEIEVPIISVLAGLNTVVGPNSINLMITAIPGIDGCYNKEATSGGQDREDSESFRNRIAAKWRGSNLGTINGLLSDVLNYSEDVIDVKVLGHEDVGREDAGAVDVYIKGYRVEQTQEVFSEVLNYSFNEIILSYQPVRSIEQVNNVALIDSSKYSLVKDTDLYAGSSRGKDKIVFNPPQPTSSGSIVVKYSYNSLIRDIQNYLLREDKLIQNVNVLVKEAIAIPISIEISAKALPGYDVSFVEEIIRDNVSQFIDQKAIGEELQQADVARVILNSTGVDDLKLPFTTFKSSDNSVLPNTFGNLNIPYNAYPTLYEIIINWVI
jgi:uncharacterized phage protein gp47/JayE